MERKYKIFCGIMAAVLAVTCVNTFYQNKYIKELEDRLISRTDRLSSEVQGVSAALGSSVGAMEQKIKEGASLFTGLRTEGGYRDGRLMLTVSLAPKELSAGDRLYISLDGEKAEMTERDGIYSAEIPCDFKDGAISPVLTIEGLLKTRSEAIEDIDAYEIFRVSAQAALGDSTVGVRFYDPNGIMEGAKSIKLIAEDYEDNEIASVELKAADMPESMAEEFIGEFQYGQYYCADIRDMGLAEGDYMMGMAVELEGGVTLRGTYMGDLSIEGGGRVGYISFRYGELYPDF